MDFNLTKEQQIIQKAAREFAKGEFTDVAREFDLNETFPAKIVEKARELGLVGLFVPFEYGGPGFGFLEQAMVLEEFWKVDPGIGQQLGKSTAHHPGPEHRHPLDRGHSDSRTVAIPCPPPMHWVASA